jgi:hypothetical protein
MLAALPQPLEVEEAGRSFFSGLAGPTVVAAAAIIAAFLAAWVARRNHAEQLANDRRLRDLDHARRSLDGAVANISEAVRALSELHLQAWKTDRAQRASRAAHDASEEFWPPHPRTEDQEEGIGLQARREEEEAIQAATAAAQEATDELHALQEDQQGAWAIQQRLDADRLRLRIAIGDESPVVKSHAELTSALHAWREGLDLGGEIAVNFGEALEPPKDPVPAAMEEFVQACQAWAADGHR